MNFVKVPETGDSAFAIPPMALYILLVVVVLVFLFAFVKLRKNQKNLKSELNAEDFARANGGSRAAPRFNPSSKLELPSNIVYEAKTALNTESIQLLNLIENAAWDVSSSFSILTRCKLGDILSPSPMGELKSQILDYVVVSKSGMPLMAAVYGGDGPSQNKWGADDPALNVIRDMMQMSGIRFLEIQAGFKPRVLKRRLKKLFKL
ncbi:MAG: hypothetical protein JKY31_11915 [Rhodobacteraceae bacterium]|nr:hypothetical protein [Paracoccaceae bacterium]